MRIFLIVTLFLFIHNTSFAIVDKFRGGPIRDRSAIGFNVARVKQAIEELKRLEANLKEQLAATDLIFDQFSLDIRKLDSLGNKDDISDLVQQMVRAKAKDVLGRSISRSELRIPQNINEEFKGDLINSRQLTSTLRAIGNSTPNLRLTGDEDAVSQDVIRYAMLEDDYTEQAALTLSLEQSRVLRENIRELSRQQIDLTDTNNSANVTGYVDINDSLSILNSWSAIEMAIIQKSELEMLGHEDQIELQYNKIALFQRRNEFIADKVQKQARGREIQSILNNSTR